MALLKKTLANLLLLTFCIGISGCWNYKEVEDMSIVSGVAIDKNEPDGNIMLTVETVDTRGGGQEAQTGGHATSKINALSGPTMFDIVRNMITLTGRKLFWSHAKAIIFSEEYAREGVVQVLDWYNRDTETRSDVYIFITKEKRAKDILELSSAMNTVISFDLGQMMDDEKHTSTAPVIEIWDFIDNLESTGRSAMAPIVYIDEKGPEKNVRVSGTAVFLNQKMVGMLNGNESKYMLFTTGELKGGVLAVEDENGRPTYSLEIISNKTKIKPKKVNGRLQIHVSSETRTGLDEVMSPEGFTSFEMKRSIEKLAEQQMKEHMLAVIQKVQKEFHADIFGFGETIHGSMPKDWDKLEKNWPQEFSELEVIVEPKVIIETSAKTSRSIKVED